jgi:hypothetical protein
MLGSTENDRNIDKDTNAMILNPNMRTVHTFVRDDDNDADEVVVDVVDEEPFFGRIILYNYRYSFVFYTGTQPLQF